MNKNKILILCLFFVILVLFPIPVTCGNPNYTCTSAPNKEGKISRNSQTEPLGAYLMELFFQVNIPFHYTSSAVVSDR